jgi:hypothetical protein
MALGPVTFTAVIDGTHRWIILSVSCTGMTGASIYRITPDGTRAVRNALDKVAAGALNVADYEAPQNQALKYVAVVTDGTLAATSSIVTVSGTIDRGGDVLFGLTNPLATVPVHVVGIPDLSTAAPQEAVHVVGRADPIIVSDVRSYPTGSLLLATVTDEERIAVNGLLADGTILAFSPRYPTYGFDDVWYLSIGGVSEKRASEVVTDPTREWTLAFQRIAPPPADFIGPAFATWNDVYTAGSTWSGILIAGTTWLDLQVV